MKLLKYLFLLILIVLIGAAIYIATLNGHFRIKENVSMKAPRSLAFNEVNKLKNWDNWTFFQKDQPGLTLSFPEESSGQQAQMSWQGDSLSNGSLKTKTVEHYSFIKQNARIETRFGHTDYNITWNFEKEADSTIVSVQIKGRLGFWSKAYGILEDTTIVQRLKPKVEKSLQQLKKQVLKKMAVFSFNVDGVQVTEPKNYIYTSLAARNKPEIIAEKRENNLKKLQAFVAENNLEKSGAPFMIYNKIDRQNGNVILSVGIPIKGEFSPNSSSDILLGTLHGQRVLKSTLKGNYDNVPKLWKNTMAYMQKNNLMEKNGAEPYEVFVSGPEDSKNPADWVTELYVPIEKNKESNKQLGF